MRLPARWLLHLVCGVPTAVLLVAAGVPARAGGPVDERPVEIETIPVDFSPFDRARTRFGRLEWRGGVELTSTDDRFGGLSGLVLTRDGNRMIAVSDLGWWFEASLGYAGGRLSAVTGARMARLLDKAGRPLRDPKLRDAESVAAGTAGDLLVAFEREPRILRYPYGRDGMAARASPVPAPAALAAGPENKELEAVGRFAVDGLLKGATVAISERHLDADGNILGWMFDSASSRTLRIGRTRDFDVTDLAIDPLTQDLLVLERRFSFLTGVGMRIRRFDAGSLTAAGPLDGEILIEADQTVTIDNMEGLEATRTADGELVLTVVSDDNYNGFQRTLLLQFVVKQ